MLALSDDDWLIVTAIAKRVVQLNDERRGREIKALSVSIGNVVARRLGEMLNQMFR